MHIHFTNQKMAHVFRNKNIIERSNNNVRGGEIIPNYSEVYLEYKGALGDTICVTAFLNELHELYGKKISIISSWPSIFENNPNVEKIIYPVDISKKLLYRIIKYLLFKILSEKTILFLKEMFFVGQTTDVIMLNISQKYLFEYRHLHLMEAIANSLGLNYQGQLPEYYFDNDELIRVKQKFKLTDEAKYIAISPFARWKSRQWEESSFQEVIKYFENAGYKILILGAPKDHYEGSGEDLTGKTTVRESAALIKLSEVYVGVDGGLAHLAVAVKTTGIIIFGPVLSGLRKHSNYMVSVENVSTCHGCSHFLDLSKYSENRECPYKHRNCMRSISSSTIIDIIKTALFDENAEHD